MAARRASAVAPVRFTPSTASSPWAATTDARRAAFTRNRHSWTDLESTLFDRFGGELLGPLAKWTHQRTKERTYPGFAWRHGFIRAAQLRRVLRTRPAEVVRTLLDHPSGRFLRRLLIRSVPYELTFDGVFAVLAERAPATLDQLVLGDYYDDVGDLTRLWTSLPRLRWLAIEGAMTSLGREIAAEALEELYIAYVDHSLLGTIARARWPRLRRLHVTLTSLASAGAHDLAPLFENGAMPSLEELSVRRWMETPTSALVPQDELANHVLDIALARKLRRVDLEMALSDAAARALVDRADALCAFEAIGIPEDAIVSSKLRASIATRLPNVRWLEAPVDRPKGLDLVEP